MKSALGQPPSEHRRNSIWLSKTQEMGTEWMEKGYIYLKGVLNSDEVAAYLATANAVITDYRAVSPEVQEKDSFHIFQMIGR